MAVRVRKLARELDRSPEDVLVLLRDLGYERFRSSDDMISEVVADHLRRAARTRHPRAIVGRAQTTMPPSRPPEAPPTPAAEDGEDDDDGAGDFMARLVPGVVRQREHVSHAPSPGRRALETEQLEAERAEVEAQRMALRAERREMAQLREQLADERAALEARAADLDRERRALDAEREALAEARAALDTTIAERSLLGLLEERGLRGVDEAERTVAVLAATHAFGRSLGQLVPTDPTAVRRILAERLVLVEGPVPDGLGVAAVVVSADRADLPAPERLARTLGRIGERCLLHGKRRVVLIGVPARWHTTIRDGLDRRVEVVFRATATASDHERVDDWVHWAEADAAGIRRTDRPAALGAFLDRWLVSLAD